MGSGFDVVLTCDLREDTPDEVIEVIRFLTDSDYELAEKPTIIVEHSNGIWEGSFEEHFLAPDPEHEVISNFQKKWRTSIPAENDRKVYRYCLQYSGRIIHDDFWAACHVPFVYWLAPYVFEDFIGYMRETTDGDLLMLIVKDGKLVGDKFNPPVNF